ncbi:MAG: L-ribulose-5-phosphate 3-epimerase [Synergistaceae bacterium]|jgi:L-ribulose-5-phosphate 3-epimerase|nr:L-ribulose-5-phosphate 3-epimerase [Synergistaceae bacterium]
MSLVSSSAAAENSFQFGIYEKAMPSSLSIREKLFCAKEFGYDYLEFSIDETDEKLRRLDMPSSQRRELANLQFDVGLPIRSICLSGQRKYPLGSTDPAVRARSLSLLRKAVELAADLGVRLIQLAGYDVYYEPSTPETERFFEEGLRTSVEIAARYGVPLAFETMETPFMDTVAKAMRYVRAVDSPYLQVYPDLGNCTNAAALYGHDVSEDLKTGRGHLAALHLKEAAPGRYREVPYGTGQVNFAEGIWTAASLGVRRFVTELWAIPDRDWRTQIAEAKEFFQRVFAAAVE